MNNKRKRGLSKDDIFDYKYHKEEFERIKKIRTDNDVEKLDLEMMNIDLEKIDKEQLNSIEQINAKLSKNFIRDNYSILTDIAKSFDKLEYSSIITLSNSIINFFGKNEYINRKYSDSFVNNEIFKCICLYLEPKTLINPYIFNSNFNEKYIGKDEHIYLITTNSLGFNFGLRNSKLESIFPNPKCYYPTWKKIYNNDVDYNFIDFNSVSKTICEKFIKKIFYFYENIYYNYFNNIISNILYQQLSKYKIIFNPHDIKFNKIIFENWMDKFIQVQHNSCKFIKNFAISIKLESIDELNKENLIIWFKDFEEIIKSNSDQIYEIFKPLDKFYKTDIPINIIKYNFINFTDDINQLFKYKRYMQLLSKNDNFLNLLN